jgi:hypothetical protein
MITHKIDPEGKYIIIIDYNGGERELEDASRFAEQLGEWWNSDEPFIVIAPYNGMKVRVEKIDVPELPEPLEETFFGNK